MRSTIGLAALLLFCIYGVVVSVKNIQIGKGYISNPIFDTTAKRKDVLKRGNIGLFVSIVSGGIFLMVLAMIII